MSELATRDNVALPAGRGANVTVHLTGGGKPAAGIGVILLLRSKTTPSTTSVQDVTNSNGTATLPFDDAVFTPVLLVIEPKSGFWGAALRNPQETVNLELV